MHLYVIRHAEAVPPEQEGIERDEDRYLTPTGQEQSRRLAQALRQRGATLEKILSSPLVRARQTAEGIVAGWGAGGPPIEQSEMLAPGLRKRKLLRELLATGSNSLAVVGHNPDMERFIGWLISRKGANIALAKAAAACIEFPGEPSRGEGSLLWLVTPEWCP